jgi:hypothetical protein
MGSDSYEYTTKRVGDMSLMVDTKYHYGGLVSPPESACEARRSSYDMGHLQTPGSTYHPNTPVHSFSSDTISLAPTDKVHLTFEDVKYPHSPIEDVYNQHTLATVCDSSSLLNPSMSSIYQDGASLLAADEDWSSSMMSHYSQVDYNPDQSHLFMVPQQDPSPSFMSDSASYDLLPEFIAPGQAVHRPEDYSNLSFSGWGTTTPVHDSNILHSSSPADFSPVTPATIDHSEEASFTNIETSPSSSIHSLPRRSSSSKKGRKSVKNQKRLSMSKNLPNSITYITDERSETFYQRKLKNPAHKLAKEEKIFKCFMCTDSFGRAEHHKRHLKKHNDERPYRCYLNDRPLAPGEELPCKAGKRKNGATSRSDNARSHNLTHLRAWLVLYDILFKALMSDLGKHPKARNEPISPVMMLRFARARGSPELCKETLEFLNKEIGKDGLHILWEEPGCPTVLCVGGAGQPGGCKMCRPPRDATKNLV